MCYQFCSTRTTYQLCRTIRRYQFCKTRIDHYQFQWVFNKTFPIKKKLVWFCWLTILWTTCNPGIQGISSHWIIQCDSTSNVLFRSIVTYPMVTGFGNWYWPFWYTLSISDALPTCTRPFPIVFFSPPYSYKKGALSLSFSSCWSFFCSLCIPIFSILVHLRV